MSKTLGIDEAGRGPVIGPMVMAGCLTNEEIDLDLKAAGVKDSKLILPAKREYLFNLVKEKVLAWYIVVVTPEEIDAALNDPEMNLNKLEGVTSAKIINEIRKKVTDEFEVMLDSPTNTPIPYIAFVSQNLEDSSIKVKAETKADMNYVSVSAGSILAKVTRDRLIQKFTTEAEALVGDSNVGSGYPSDPKTKDFVAKYYNKLNSVKGGFFRKTWSTYKKVIKDESQQTL